MKKSLVAIMMVLSMLVMFVGTVSAASLASGTATLVGVEYVPGKGPVFTFAVSGEFTKADLKGSLHIEGGDDFDLYCTQVDSSTVTCTVSKKAAGKNVVLSWGGSKFWTSVPLAPEFCYNIYDWASTMDAWVNYGSHCQDRSANYGDQILWDNPEWGTSLYIFLPESPTCPFYQPGDAYYYPSCPF
jgi:hypothetical protein